MIEIGDKIYEGLNDLAQRFPTSVAHHVMDSLAPEIEFCTKLRNSLQETKAVDITHDIVISSGKDIENLEKEADAIALLLYETVGTGDKDSAVSYFDRLRSICLAVDTTEFHIIWATGLQNVLLQMVADREMFDHYYDEFDELVRKEYHLDIMFKWVMVTENCMSRLLHTDVPRALATISKLSVIHLLKSSSKQISNIFWEITREIMEHYIANFDLSSATKIFRRILKMKKMPSKFYDGVSLCHAALTMYFFCERLEEKEDVAAYLSIANDVGTRQYNYNYSLQYNIARAHFETLMHG